MKVTTKHRKPVVVIELTLDEASDLSCYLGDAVRDYPPNIVTQTVVEEFDQELVNAVEGDS